MAGTERAGDEDDAAGATTAPGQPAAPAAMAEADAQDSRHATVAAPPPPLTAWRFLGAFLLDCVLFFVVLVIFAFAGLGPLGLAPAIVVATALTGRVTRIRRMSVLIAVGVLAFVTTVVVTYVVAVVVYLSSTPAAG